MNSFTKPRVPTEKIEHNDLRDLLEKIIDELKIMNAHFAEWDGDKNDCS
jgi:hypothetical protein